jgi:hypothetical protein
VLLIERVFGKLDAQSRAIGEDKRDDRRGQMRRVGTGDGFAAKDGGEARNERLSRVRARVDMHAAAESGHAGFSFL